MKRRTFLPLAASCLATPAVWAQTRASNSWRIASSLPLTGAQASYGEAKRDGAAAYASMINAKGGIAGRKLQLHVVDDAYVEARTGENIAALLKEHSPVAYTGFFGAPSCVVAAKTLAQLQQVGVGFTTGSNAFRTQPQREVFPVRASFVRESEAIVQHQRTTGIKQAVVAYVNIPFGQLAKDTFEAAAQAQGLALAPPIEVKADGSNLADAVKALKAHTVILMGLHTPSAMSLVQALRKDGETGQQLWCLSAVDTAVMAGKLKEASRGVATSLVVPSVSKVSIAIVREYLSATQAINKPPSSYGLEAFIEMKTLGLGLARLRGEGPQAMITAMESIGKNDIGGFEVMYGPGDRTGARYVDLAIISDFRNIRS